MAWSTRTQDVPYRCEPGTGVYVRAARVPAGLVLVQGGAPVGDSGQRRLAIKSAGLRHTCRRVVQLPRRIARLALRRSAFRVYQGGSTSAWRPNVARASADLQWCEE